jgi:hypothetical protein
MLAGMVQIQAGDTPVRDNILRLNTVKRVADRIQFALFAQAKLVGIAVLFYRRKNTLHRAESYILRDILYFHN